MQRTWDMSVQYRLSGGKNLYKDIFKLVIPVVSINILTLAWRLLKLHYFYIVLGDSWTK